MNEPDLKRILLADTSFFNKLRELVSSSLDPKRPGKKYYYLEYYDFTDESLD